MTDAEPVPVRFPAPAEYPIHELISARWSPRSFDPDRPVEEDKLRRVFEAARWAPSCFNEQPWAYNIFTTSEPDTLDRARGCLSEGNEWARRAPVLAFGLVKLDFEYNGKRNRFAAYDTGQATMLAVLQALELGLICHQMAGYSRSELERLFPAPEGYAYMAALAIDYPSTPPRVLTDSQRAKETERRPRLPQSDFVHFHGWGWK